MEKSDTNTNENLTWNHKDQGRSVSEGGNGGEGVCGGEGRSSSKRNNGMGNDRAR